MDDFIFGTLATDELRREHVRARRSGITHAHARTPHDPRPGEPVTLQLSVGPSYPLDEAWLYWTSDGNDPEGAKGKATCGHSIPMQSTNVEWDTMLWGYVRQFQATLPEQPDDTIVRYRLSAGSRDGEEIFADDGAYYAYYVADDPTPQWTRDAVIYHIFVDRFYPGTGKKWLQPATLAGFCGGTLRGITDQLDYIADLGANTLWLSPIFPSPSHHGYDATDYFDIEPRLGTKKDLRDLLDATHARGIRVLLDLVPNHWSSEHITFKQALSNPQSEYREWYSFTNYPEEYKSFFTVRSLPQINLRSRAAREHMLEAVTHWLEFGVDGYRLDYAIGPTPDFWADFRRATRKAKPECWTFGEAVDTPDSQLALEGLLDGTLDFILLEALRETFAFGRWSGTRFSSFLERHQSFFPPNFSRPSFLDNHDTNRFLWAARGDKRRLKLAALCQFTLAGAPIIYYGTEVGLSQQRDIRQPPRDIFEEARLPMLWGAEQDRELLSFYRAVVALRQRESILRRGAWRALHADAETFAYARGERENELAVALNLSTDSRQVILAGSWQTIAFATDEGCALRRTGDQAEVALPPLAGVVLQS